MNNQFIRIGHLVITTFVFSIASLIGQGSTALGGNVFIDSNNDGFQSPGESTLGEIGFTVSIELYSSDGSLQAITTTDADGFYFFSIAPGDYYIEFLPPFRFGVTSANAVLDDNDIDGDNNGSQADTDNNLITDGLITSPMITLSEGDEPINEAGNTANDADTNLTIDFGLLECQEISGNTFIDLDINGCRDDNEELEYARCDWKLFVCDTSGMPGAFGEGALIEEDQGLFMNFDGNCYTAQNTFYLEVIPPPNLLITSRNMDCPDDRNSDFSFMGQTDCFTMGEEINTEHIDLGLDPISPTQDISREIELEISPNPVEELVELLTTDPIVSIELHNLTGQSVPFHNPDRDLNKIVLDLGHLVRGTYFVVVRTSKGRATRKLIKSD